jgi:hypothetical protein
MSIIASSILLNMVRGVLYLYTHNLWNIFPPFVTICLSVSVEEGT